MTRPTTRCKRPRCGLTYAEHVDERCADNRRFRSEREYKDRSASQSFSADEVDLMDTIMRGLARGADLRLLARTDREAFARLARKAQSMRQRIESARAARKAGESAS